VRREGTGKIKGTSMTGPRGIITGYAHAIYVKTDFLTYSPRLNITFHFELSATINWTYV
jgi:hypothetical protein